MADIIIKTVQFKRGLEANLIAKLIPVEQGGLGVPLAGEPVYAIDTKVLKIGDGIKDYEHLDPITGGGGGGEDNRFAIHNPLDGQVLLYDDDSGKWVNKNLADEDSIIYLANHGLTLKGYDQAAQGQMLVKDINDGLAWVNPVTTQDLQPYVTQAYQSAVAAGQSAQLAGEAQIAAEDAATIAETINTRTMDFVNNKFWWGTLSEYNELQHIDDGVFYFITAEE